MHDEPHKAWWQILYFKIPQGSFHVKKFSCVLTCPGDLSDGAGCDLAFMDGEQLEDDEELRLHIHGCNSFFTKWAPQNDTYWMTCFGAGMTSSPGPQMNTNLEVHRKRICWESLCPSHKIPSTGLNQNDLVWVFHGKPFHLVPDLQIKVSFETLDIRLLPQPVSQIQLPRYATFWRRYKSTWKNILRFTPQTDHSTCDTCLDCKERFKTSIEPWVILIINVWLCVISFQKHYDTSLGSC